MSTPFHICFVNFMWNIYCIHLRSHMQTLFHVQNMHLRRQKGSHAHQTQFWYFLSTICKNKLDIWISIGKISNFKKQSSKMESGKWSYDRFKINKISALFRKRPYGFQNFIQNLFGYYTLQEDKVDLCGNINDA